MGDWKFAIIVIGVAGALLGVYFREAVRLAHQQKLIAIKLEAYLLEWQRDLFDGVFSEFFLLGNSWQKEESDAVIHNKGLKGLQDVQEKYKKGLADLKEAIESGEHGMREGLEKTCNNFKNMTDVEFSFYMKTLDEVEAIVIKNQSFISDDEAAALSWVCAQHVIPMKASMLSMTRSSKELMIASRKDEHFNLSKVAGVFYKILESAILLSKHYSPLLKYSESIRNKSLLALTFNNLF